MTERPVLVRLAEVPVHERGSGVCTVHLLTDGSVEETPFVTGITQFEPGAAVDFHWHNCAESVLVLDGRARFESVGLAHDLEVNDLTFVPTGVVHRVSNIGASSMRLFFVYGASAPTRTMADSGETFPIGSNRDVVGPRVESKVD